MGGCGHFTRAHLCVGGKAVEAGGRQRWDAPGVTEQGKAVPWAAGSQDRALPTCLWVPDPEKPWSCWGHRASWPEPVLLPLPAHVIDTAWTPGSLATPHFWGGCEPGPGDPLLSQEGRLPRLCQQTAAPAPGLLPPALLQLPNVLGQAGVGILRGCACRWSCHACCSGRAQPAEDGGCLLSEPQPLAGACP